MIRTYYKGEAWPFPHSAGERECGSLEKQVTLVKLPLHALHLRLVPADPVDALGAQACWKEEKNIVSANFAHLIDDGFAAAAAAAAAGDVQ